MTTFAMHAAPAQTDNAVASEKACLRQDESELVAALRAGDEEAFEALVTRYQGALVGAATRYLRDASSAQDVVQETWIGFLDSLPRFEGRCSIKTWLFRILFNKAKTRSTRERRCVPFSSLVSREMGDGAGATDPTRFRTASAFVEAGHWTQSGSWGADPCRSTIENEAVEIARRAMDGLPKAQGDVMFLRDVQGLSAEEVCRALAVSPGNQRVLLHRARTKVRDALIRSYGEKCWSV